MTQPRAHNIISQNPMSKFTIAFLFVLLILLMSLGAVINALQDAEPSQRDIEKTLPDETFPR